MEDMGEEFKVMPINRTAAMFFFTSLISITMIAWLSFLSWGMYSLSQSIFSIVETWWPIVTALIREV